MAAIDVHLALTIAWGILLTLAILGGLGFVAVALWIFICKLNEENS